MGILSLVVSIRSCGVRFLIPVLYVGLLLCAIYDHSFVLCVLVIVVPGLRHIILLCGCPSIVSVCFWLILCYLAGHRLLWFNRLDSNTSMVYHVALSLLSIDICPPSLFLSCLLAVIPLFLFLFLLALLIVNLALCFMVVRCFLG